MDYVSLVGTQTMAVLNPLLALIDDGEKPEKVGLFHTFRTTDRAATIKNHLVNSGHYIEDKISLKLISTALDNDSYGNPPPQKAIVEFSQPSNSYFNLAGGLNYQIAACIAGMDGEYHLLYPESTGVHYFKCRDHSVDAVALLNLPSPVDVLSLQGVACNQGDGNWSKPQLLRRLLEEGNIPLSLPKGLRKNVVIDGVHFDYIFNVGNELRFLKIIEKEQSEKLSATRDLITLATTRKSFGDLFHRSVIVITDDSGIAERLRTEGHDKVKVVRVKDEHDTRGRTDRIDPKSRKNLIKYLYLRFDQSSATNTPKPRTIMVGNNNTGNGRMHVVLGRDILPTFITVWTHRPEDLVLLYTSNDKKIEAYRSAIIRNKSILPVSKFSFLPISLTGEDIINNEHMVDGNIINISPGTKSQTAFLTMWAKAHNASVYSLLNTQRKAVEIGGNSSSIPMSAPDPLTLLKLSGVTIKAEGGVDKDKTKLLNNCAEYKRIIDSIKNGTCHRSGDGIWFERLIGFCLCKCGADDVHVRIRTEWSRQRQEYLERKYNELCETFKNDIDVSARVGSIYYVVECKATEKKDLSATTQKAQADASLFGRFAVPLVAFLRYNGEPFKENDVYVFGRKTFTEQTALRQLLDKAVRERHITLPDDQK